jgi:alpha,alpha-trehalase
MDDEFAGDGGGDEGTVGGALHLFDGVDGGEGDDGGAVFFDGGDGALDGFWVDEGADGVVNQDDVGGRGAGQGGEGVGDGVLAEVAAGDDVDFAAKLVVGQQGGDARLFRLANGDVNGGDARNSEEGLQGVQKDGLALECEKLLGSAAIRCGHAGADSGGGKDDEDRHGKVSITRDELVREARDVQGIGWGSRIARSGMDRRTFNKTAAAYTVAAAAGRAGAVGFQPAAGATLQADWKRLDDSIRGWWDMDLHRADEAAIRSDPTKSLLFLPFPYITPGGSEAAYPSMYGWDTHFTNLALLEHGRADIVRWHILNQLSLIERYGKVLNGNNSYYLSRGQPPLLAWSVRKYLEVKPDDDEIAEVAYPLLERAYTGYWNGPSHSTPTGLSTCRDAGGGRLRQELADEAETGLDFTAIYDGNVAHCVPLHVNVALVVMAEQLGALATRFGWLSKAARWRQDAAERTDRIQRYCWDDARGCYLEYDFVRDIRLPYLSLNMYWPMWAGIASKVQAQRLVAMLGHFDQPFGLSFTDRAYPSPHPEFKVNQWSYPESWPPEQIVVAQALAQYGFAPDAQRVSRRFIGNMVAVWEKTGKIWERYNAVSGGIEMPVERDPPQAMHGFSSAAAVVVGRIAFG